MQREFVMRVCPSAAGSLCEVERTGAACRQASFSDRFRRVFLILTGI